MLPCVPIAGLSHGDRRTAQLQTLSLPKTKGAISILPESLCFIVFIKKTQKTFECVVTVADQNDVTAKLNREATICESENDACFHLVRRVAAWVMPGMTPDARIPLRGLQITTNSRWLNKFSALYEL